MSLSALPMKLDNNIVEHCDHESLIAMCSTSKYWRNLAEPHCYENLCFAIDEPKQMKLILLTLLKQPELAGYIKSFQIAPSTVPEKPIPVFFPWGAEDKDEDEEHDEGEPPSMLSIEALEQQQHREQAVRDEYQALLPNMEKILKDTWPNLCPDMLSQLWLDRMNADGNGFDHLLALILTLETNIKYLDIQLPKHSSLQLTRMLLIYHRTVKEVTGGQPYPFWKLKRRSLRSGYFKNLEALRLSKIGSDHQWYSNERIDWPNFGLLLSESLPRLREFEISIWWDQPHDGWEQVGLEDLNELVGDLKVIPGLDVLAIDLELLIHSFTEDAITEVLDLPKTVLPDKLKRFDITNVNLAFLDRIVSEYSAAERRDVLSQLMAALPYCSPFIIETYEKPSDHTVEVLKSIGTDLRKVGADLEVWRRDGKGDKDHHLV